MHLLRTTPLVEALGRQAVPAEDRAKYLLASFVAFNLIYYSGLAVSSAPIWTLPSLIEAAAIIGINVIGVVSTFDAAGGKDNPDYITEFTCLYVPVSITTCLAVWTGYWAIRWGFSESIQAFSFSNLRFAQNLLRIGTDLMGFLTLCANVLALFITYRRLGRLLTQVRLAKQPA